MKINSKNYNKYLAKELLNAKKIILLCNFPLKNKERWLKTEQLLKENNCSFFRIKNKILIKNLNDNLFFNLKGLVNGPILFLKLNDIKSFLTLKKTFPIYLLKASDKLYVFEQISKINTLDFKSNVGLFNNNLTLITKKISVLLLKAKKKNSISE